MSGYNFKITQQPAGDRELLTIHSSDGSGDDEMNKFALYEEDLGKLIKVLMERKGIDVDGDDFLRDILSDDRRGSMY